MSLLIKIFFKGFTIIFTNFQKILIIQADSNPFLDNVRLWMISKFCC
jgi:hypothetical protein